MALARQMKLDVDINTQLETRLMPGVLQQGDDNANVFVITVRAGKEKADLSSCSVTGYFQRGDSDRVPLEGSINENVVSVPLQAECYAVSGAYTAFVRLVKAGTGEKATILRIAGYVETEGSGAILDPSGRIPSIEDIIAQLDEMERATEEAQATVEEAQAAAEAARQAAESAADAGEAAEAANQAAGRADNAAAAIEEMTVEAHSVPYGTGASATLDKTGAGYRVIIYTERGQQGETGHGLDIKGTYATLEILKSSVPNPSQGDMYNVGTKVPHSIYMWDDGLGDWIYQGELQGATGAHFTPVITETEDSVMLGWTNDGGLENPIAVNIRGEDGKTPVKGTDYWTDADKTGIVQDVLAALPNARGMSF